MLDTAGARSKARKKSGRQGQKAGRSPLPSPPKDRQTTLPKQSTTQKSMFFVYSRPRFMALNRFPVTASAAMAKPLVIKPALLNPCLAPISPSLSPELPHTAPLMSTDHSQDDSSGDRLAQLETRGTGILKYARSLGTFREGKVATFDNGMRTSSEGHGRMNKDYCGVVLPLLPAYGPDGKGPHSAPWMVQGEIYELLLDGYSRLGTETIVHSQCTVTNLA